MTGLNLGDVLGPWASGAGPRYVQLAAAVRAAVERYDLAPGTRLPPERQIADSLGVSRTTVVAALDRLKQDGWLEARQGAGTWVATRGETLGVSPDGAVYSSYPVQRLLRSTREPAPALIDMASAAFPEPAGVTEALATLDLDPGGIGMGYLPYGHPDLRAAIASHLSARGLPTVPSQILITTGVAQAITLLAQLFLPNREPVVLENPTWTGTLDAITAHGSKIRSLPVDDQGARVDLVPDAIAKSQADLVLVTPDFHNPTGAQLTLGRRRRLAELAHDLQVPVVENIALAGLHLGDTPLLPPIASFSPDRWILTVGSFSKVVWAGLRIGWVRSSEPTIDRLARLKAVADNGTPVLSQLVVLGLIDRFDELAAGRRAHAEKGLATLTAALAERLPTWRPKPPVGGLSMWTQLPHGSAHEFARVALHHGVDLSPGPIFCADESHHDHVRLPFVAPPAVLVEAVDRLAAAWADYEREREAL
ncbi:PLP-dependent aminotransferase family protein [Nocardioides sp. L-11A]|uniref:aminotransferase-like domain-containing protein n=1 Tax=Nocardioides sp. L-11A TaxID=3043848 RepID=UPI00249ABB60|nr:PLP-dependent aminotransferase family protein [Nocardioides sp. L-11A]